MREELDQAMSHLSNAMEDIGDNDRAMPQLREAMHYLRRLAALAPSTQQGEPIAYTRDNGPGKVVGLEWNPNYPVSSLQGRIALYTATSAPGVDDAVAGLLHAAIKKVDLIERYRINPGNAYHDSLMDIRAAIEAALTQPTEGSGPSVAGGEQ